MAITAITRRASPLVSQRSFTSRPPLRSPCRRRPVAAIEGFQAGPVERGLVPHLAAGSRSGLFVA